MKSLSQNVLWILLVCAVGLGLVWQFYPLDDAKNRIDTLPLDGPDYSGKMLFLTPFEEEFFNGVNVLKRVYKIGNRQYFVTILDGTRNRHVVHDPYYCFRGAGWEILNARSVLIPGGDAKLISIEKSGEKKEALFWFSNTKEHYASPMLYWWQSMLRRLSFGLSGPEPILIMIQPLDGEKLDIKALEQQFQPIFQV